MVHQPNCKSGTTTWMTLSRSCTSRPTNDFTDHINSQSEHIKFTIEEEQDEQLPFLDTLVIVNDDGMLQTKIYWKNPHTDQYLNWDSNHHLKHKRSVVRTLICSTETVVSELDDVEEEMKHVKKVLTVTWYKKWSFQIPPKKVREEDKQTNRRSYCQQALGVHHLHLWVVKTTTKGIQISQRTLLRQTFEHQKAPVG